ncbi:uncharacterized protein MONBRDRAFT_26733 [Monosiga brevicollis MX1]|uniref:Uncharacterized protein n=1 Tax=Monosiga brevicollis TaxID=81824 RepID=A9V376_MONBE|nr:uncharacterized protein MONBRDRAFT_26733 [Monosiga brevicollis MX1]EDQ88140.1 predicted protein [Monosiga brevicollis MX1]|eukprot:XP_001747216.1 hypothetical protein [Monosiga brevicollis MX1]
MAQVSNSSTIGNTSHNIREDKSSPAENLSHPPARKVAGQRHPVIHHHYHPEPVDHDAHGPEAMHDPSTGNPSQDLNLRQEAIKKQSDKLEKLNKEAPRAQLNRLRHDPTNAEHSGQPHALKSEKLQRAQIGGKGAPIMDHHRMNHMHKQRTGK